MKNILMIAYHFPPVRVSSGIQRTLKFANYLLDHGWNPLILSVNTMAYERSSDDQMHEIPAGVVVKRAFALDTAKHLSLKGRYFGWMALPDRWGSWCLGGVLSGIRLIFQYRPKVIWSTYPIATAHLIGLLLHRLTGLPWVADFRDSMTEDAYPSNPTRRKIYRWIERQTVTHCSRSVFTTPGAIRMYAERYPEIPVSRWALIPNGYDEENFARAEASEAYAKAVREKTEKIVLLHSGVLYPSERDPTHFFAAVRKLKLAGQIVPGDVKIVLRATGHDDLHSKMIADCDLQDIVFLEPSIGYEAALAEMLTVDGLLIFQAANCNHQIPAKLYEYLRARKPILALTDPIGDTAQVMFDAGFDSVVPLNNDQVIAHKLVDFIKNVRNHPVLTPHAVISQYSRQAGAEKLSKIINSL